MRSRYFRPLQNESWNLQDGTIEVEPSYNDLHTLPIPFQRYHSRSQDTTIGAAWDDRMTLSHILQNKGAQIRRLVSGMWVNVGPHVYRSIYIRPVLIAGSRLPLSVEEGTRTSGLMTLPYV